MLTKECFSNCSAKVIPLPKTISTDLNDYRPISILSVLTKSLERHTHKHSCQTAVTRLTDTWLSAFNNRQMPGAVFLDFRKAFGLVNHILLQKLSSYNLSLASIMFFSDLAYRVVYNAYL